MIISSKVEFTSNAYYSCRSAVLDDRSRDDPQGSRTEFIDPNNIPWTDWLMPGTRFRLLYANLATGSFTVIPQVDPACKRLHTGTWAMCRPTSSTADSITTKTIPGGSPAPTPVKLQVRFTNRSRRTVRRCWRSSRDRSPDTCRRDPRRRGRRSPALLHGPRQRRDRARTDCRLHHRPVGEHARQGRQLMGRLAGGKVAFITGGARGQGRAHAVRFV